MSHLVELHEILCALQRSNYKIMPICIKMGNSIFKSFIWESKLVYLISDRIVKYTVGNHVKLFLYCQIYGRISFKTIFLLSNIRLELM